MRQKPAFKYWGFGLTIASEIEFPELLPYTFDFPDVTISIGNIPARHCENILQKQIFKYILTSNSTVFFVDGSANYAVENGAAIITEPVSDSIDTGVLRLFILTFCLPAILWQRRLVPMHASAILYNNELICITGNSGAGKSSSVAGLSKKGYKAFSDDVVVVNSALTVNSSYPIVKLWNDAQQQLNDDIYGDQSFAMWKGANKFGIFFHENFDTNTYPIKKILILKNDNINNIDIKQLNNMDAFVQLRKHVFRNFLIHGDELNALAFRVVSSLVNSRPVYEIIRPQDCGIDELVNEIENLMLI
jgi:hypothetical protein